MRRTFGVCLGMMALAAALLGCTSSESKPQRNLVIVGSGGMIPLLNDIVERYREQNPQVRFDIQSCVGDRAVADTRQGLADIGLLGRALRPEETGVLGHPLAQDGVAFVVHRSNTLPFLHETHLVGVLTRVYTTWKDVGGSDRPIIVVGLGEGRAVREVLLEYFALRPQQLRPDTSLATSRQVLQAVASQPAAIGYCSLGVAEVFSGKQSVRLLPFNGVAASSENVRNRTYPLVRPMQLLTHDKPSNEVKLFLDFACSEAVHDLIHQHGLSPATP